MPPKDQSELNLPNVGFFYHPNDMDTIYRLGLQMQLEGRLTDSALFLERAVELAPDQPAIRNSLGNLYLKLGELDKAADHLEAGLAIAPDHKELLSNRGLVYGIRKDYHAASACFEKALTIDPNFMHARDHLDFLYKDIVPSWHFSMMHDVLRNDAYDRAIRNVVGPDTLVLEIGTGAGLLAMMAARAGAKHVVTTEMVPVIAETAQQVVARNGFGEQVTVLAKKSTALQVGVDLPEPADVLITETFDAGFLGEAAIPSIAHAREFLLKPDAVILPGSATVFGCLLESRKLWEECAVDAAAGFDLTPFNQFRENVSGKYVQNYPHRRLSADFELFHFDFCGDMIRDEVAEQEVEVRESGTLHMLIYWFQLQFGDGNVIDTNIEDQSCWRIAVQIMETPKALERGEKIGVVAHHNRTCMKLRVR